MIRWDVEMGTGGELKNFVSGLALLLGFAASALAGGELPVPEIGASGAASAMMVIGGLTLMIRSRRK